MAQLAFGDLSPKEAAELERQAQQDPEAARRLNEYRAMRSSLRGLSESVPPDQLSKERLRAAILAGGLQSQREPETARRNWLWMPVMAAAASYVVLTLWNQGTTKTPTVVMENSGPKFDTQLTEPTKSIVASAPVELPPVKAQEPKPVLVAANDSKTERKPRTRRRAPVVIEDTPAVTDEEIASLVASNNEARHRPVAPQPPSQAPEGTGEATMVLTSSASAGPIVLIDTNKNSETGANTAMEVGSTNNVLVGG